MHFLAAAMLASRRPESLRSRLALALALFAAGLALRVQLAAPDGLTFAPFYPVVFAAFLLAGTGPGVLCTALSLLAQALLLPAGPTRPSIGAEAALFAAVSVAVGGLAFLLQAQCAAAQDQALKDRSALAEHAAQLQAARQRHDELLAEGRRQMEMFYEQAPCGYHSLAPDGTILSMNRTALDWLGITRQDAIGRPIADFFTDEGRAQFAATFPQFLRKGSVRDLEFELRARDDGRRVVSVSAQVIRNPDGSLAASRSVMLDVSELKRTRQALMEHQQRLRALSQLPLPIALLRRSDCVVLEANRAFLDLVGYPEQELLGRSAVALGLWPDHAELQGLLSQVETQGGARDFALHVRRRSGQVENASCSCTPVRQGGVDCLLTALLDLVTTVPPARAPAPAASTKA